MGRPAISDDELAALLVGEFSMPGVRLGAALSTASPCSSTKPLQSPLFADVPALNTAVAEKAGAEAHGHGQGQGRQGLSRRPPRAAMSEAEAAFAKRLCEDVERLARAQRSKRFRCDPPPPPPTMQGRNRPTIYPPPVGAAYGGCPVGRWGGEIGGTSSDFAQEHQAARTQFDAHNGQDQAAT